MGAKPAILLAPGAGAPSSHPWMQAWKLRLGQLGDVTTFDYDYMREGRKRPDRPPQLIAAHRAALLSLRASSDGPLFLAGKSMGGRIGCHLALEETVAGLICFGYPLCAHETARRNPAATRDTSALHSGNQRSPLPPRVTRSSSFANERSERFARGRRWRSFPSCT